MKQLAIVLAVLLLTACNVKPEAEAPVENIEPIREQTTIAPTEKPVEKPVEKEEPKAQPVAVQTEPVVEEEPPPPPPPAPPATSGLSRQEMSMYLIPISQEIMQVLYVNVLQEEDGYNFLPFSQFEHSILELATPEMTQQVRAFYEDPQFCINCDSNFFPYINEFEITQDTDAFITLSGVESYFGERYPLSLTYKNINGRFKLHSFEYH